MGGKRDYYAELGVAADADPVVIRAAYRALMLKFHPDTCREPASADRAKAINEAFAILNDPVKRAAYDHSQKTSSRTGGSSASGGKSSAGGAPPPPPSPPPKTTTPPKPPTSNIKKWADSNWIGPMALAAAIFLVIALNSQSHSVANDLGKIDPAYASQIDTAADMNTTVDRMTSLPEPAATQLDASILPAIPQNIDPPQVKFEDVEAGARDFAKILSRSGLGGARAYSTKCYGAAGNDWSKIDRCVAFDRAAFLVDQQVTRGTDGTENAYFAFSQIEPVARYNVVSTNGIYLRQRIDQVNRGVTPAINEAMNAMLAKREQERSQVKQPREPTVAEAIASGSEPAIAMTR